MNDLEKTKKWYKLLSTKRFNEIFNTPYDPIRSQYLKDVDRIVYSTYFRTLQDKTQVHPLAKSSTIRTRLTHSLETAGVGRSLGYSVGSHIIKKYKIEDITEHDIGYILQAACLAHDIGNPPFGHVGESAIIAFFKEKQKELSHLSDHEFQNLTNFDGNPQGFRIISKLAMHYLQGGLNLTYATLGTFLKYPRACSKSIEIKQNFKNRYNTEKVIGTNKLGVFSSETQILEDIAKELGLIRLSESNEPIFYRHPLAFLLEASDDICYLIADIEDAHSVGLTSIDKVEELLAPIARKPCKYGTDISSRINNLKKEPFYKELSEEKKVEWLRGKAIGNLIIEISDVFIKHEEDILLGNLNDNLLNLSIYKEDIARCRSYANKIIFLSKDKISSEIKGVTAIQEVLNELYYAILKHNHPKRQRMERLFGIKFQTKENSKEVAYDDLVTMLDFVSSCTDRKLLEFHNILKAN